MARRKKLTLNTPWAGGRPLGCTPDKFRVITLLPDGTKHSASGLAKMFGVNQASISWMVRQGKKVFHRDELVRWYLSKNYYGERFTVNSLLDGR